jgi:hypothetical protein
MAPGVGPMAVDRIPSEGWHGAVGQRVGEEASEVWTPIWGLGRGDAHWRTLSVVA